MKLKNKIIHRLFWGLLISEKILFLCSVLWILSSFFTWFSLKESFSWVLISYNAFTWICAVLWYFFFIFMICIFLFTFLKQNNIKLSTFLKKQNWIYLFLTWESLFISICVLLIYSSYWFSSPYSSIWIWLYIAIISQIIWLFWAHYFFISNYKKE